jgi:uncharacterized protein
MLGWFQALMPREERFFQLFEKHATIVVAGAEALRGLLRGGDNIEACCKEIFQREAEADEVTRQVLVAVRRTFITPFDRTDIQDLITSAGPDAAQKRYGFQDELRGLHNDLAHLLHRGLERAYFERNDGRGGLVHLIDGIVHRRPPHRPHRKAHQCRRRGGYDLQPRPQGVIPRQSKGNAMSFVVGSQVYDHLEKVVDRFEDVANEISSLVVDQL